jgi:hypothetical protein
VTNANPNPGEPDNERDSFRKLVRSFIVVLVLLLCAALLLALGECARRGG